MHIRKQSEKLFIKIIDFIYLHDNPAVRREFYSQTKQRDCHARRQSQFLKIIASDAVVWSAFRERSFGGIVPSTRRRPKVQLCPAFCDRTFEVGLPQAMSVTSKVQQICCISRMYATYRSFTKRTAHPRWCMRSDTMVH